MPLGEWSKITGSSYTMYNWFRPGQKTLWKDSPGAGSISIMPIVVSPGREYRPVYLLLMTLAPFILWDSSGVRCRTKVTQHSYFGQFISWKAD